MAEMNTAPTEGGSKAGPAARLVGVPLSRTPATQPRGGTWGSGGAATPFTAAFALGALRLWWKIALPCGLVLAAAAAAGVAWLFPPVYQATAWLKISDSTPFLAFQSGADSRRFLETQMESMRSPLVLGPVVSRPEIAQLPEIRGRDAPVVWLGGQIKASSVGQSELVRIAFEAKSPATAAAVVNAVVNSYLDFRGHDDSEQMLRMIELLEEEKARRMREVETMRETLRELTKQATGKDPFAPKSRTDAQGNRPLADLQAKLVDAEVTRQVLEVQVQAVEETAAKGKLEVPEGLIEQAVEEHRSVQALRAALTAKKMRLQEYERTLARGKEDPLHQALTKEIARDEAGIQDVCKTLREDVRKEALEKMKNDRKTAVARIHNTLDNARLLERLLRERDKSLHKNVQEASVDTLQLEFKQTELARAEQVLAMIAERAIKLRTEQRAPARVVLMQKADEATATVSWTSYYRRIIAAALLGLCLPVPLVAGWEWLARRVSDVKQIELCAHLPVLGEITRLPPRSGLARLGLSRRAGLSMGLFEESIDSLRTCLVLSDALRDARVLAITSASKKEGKTSIALQLAISIARASGQRVLLIDADMRSPDIHDLLHIRRGPGLAEVLGHRCSVEDGIVTDWGKLVHVMPAGTLAASPHKLVGNGALKALMDAVRPCYGYIVVDTPPILPASEALVLARAADACLVCAMRDVSRIDWVRRSCERLAAAGARPVGIILNGVPVRQYAQHYGTYYGQVPPAGDDEPVKAGVT